MTFLTLVPMAFVMIAGPQILSAIFLATSDDWRRNSIAYVLGAALSITAIITAAFFIGGGGSSGGPSSDTLYYIVLGLLLLAMLRTYLKREESEPPKWMGKLQEASPGFSFKLGFLLLGVFPTDILTSVAVGSFLAAHGDPWWHLLPFLALTLLFLATPLLVLLIMGDRGQALLPKVRQWMTDNSWVVNELVLLLFVGLTVSNLA
jgi:threonine/homoserine/homoserine lactone efflux protein